MMSDSGSRVKLLPKRTTSRPLAENAWFDFCPATPNAGRALPPNPTAEFDALLHGPAPVLALAPMQDITDLRFWRLMAQYGGPDLYWTEYFRVHPTYYLEKAILKSVIENPTGRPAVAQLIGNDIPSLVRVAKDLQRHPVGAIDLNLGCPAPVVYRKCAGGGLLREPARVDAILGALRDAISIRFTVKTRIGFHSSEVFEELLPIFARHSLDLLTVHARTVQQMYRLPVHYDFIARAAAALPCPVLANGHVHSPDQALAVLAQTRARGLMIGRGAIRNPWLFSQIRQRLRGESSSLPTGRKVLEYLRALWETMCVPCSQAASQVQRMKKFINFIGEGIEPAAQFLHEIRRVHLPEDFFRVCTAYLDHDRPMRLEPPAMDAPDAPAVA
jgi:tRNA-dihydrouridine synthase B